jgi:hypothetical protein
MLVQFTPYLNRSVRASANERRQLVLNEQYMVSAHAAPTNGKLPDSNGPTNKVIKILCYHGTDYRTFGENIVLLINRESETYQPQLAMNAD